MLVVDQRSMKMSGLSTFVKYPVISKSHDRILGLLMTSISFAVMAYSELNSLPPLRHVPEDAIYENIQNISMHLQLIRSQLNSDRALNSLSVPVPSQ